MAEYIELVKRVKYAGDVHTELLKAGWDLETATLFVNNIPDAAEAKWIWRKYDKRRSGYEADNAPSAMRYADAD